MMIRTLPIAVLLLAGSLLPGTASAYVLPEEVLDAETASVRLLEPPPAARHVPDIQREQAAKSAARRQAALDTLRDENAAARETAIDGDDGAADAEEGEGQTGTVPVDAVQLESVLRALEELKNKEAAATGRDVRDERTLQRIRLQQEQSKIRVQVAQELDVLRDREEALHSGAPLADTGPASLLAAMAVFAAIVLTLRWVRGAERR